MCGCFRINPNNREIAMWLDHLPEDSAPVKTGDVFPGDIAVVICGNGEKIVVRAMAWGFPKWDGKGLVFNARAETALEKPMFRKAMLQSRAVVPVSGFYEWRKSPEKTKKDKFFFTNGPILYLAAIWRRHEAKDTNLPGDFTLLTTQANASMRPYHSRMPLLLSAEDCRSWISGVKTAELLAEIPPPLDIMEAN